MMGNPWRRAAIRQYKSWGTLRYRNLRLYTLATSYASAGLVGKAATVCTPQQHSSAAHARSSMHAAVAAGGIIATL